MLETLAEGVVVACPAALACATVVVSDRRDRRRRESLNRGLHELRRPLQALALQLPHHVRRPARGQLDQALEALAGIDREVNGGRRPARRTAVDPRALAADAVARWRVPAALSGRRIELTWGAASGRLVCDEVAIAAALDNLIANAIEHGRGAIRVEGSSRAGRLRLTVADGADAGGVPPARAASPGLQPSPHRRGRRGHGLRLVAEVATEHGGRFAACAHERGASAVLELPLGESPARLRRG